MTKKANGFHLQCWVHLLILCQQESWGWIQVQIKECCDQLVMSDVGMRERGIAAYVPGLFYSKLIYFCRGNYHYPSNQCLLVSIATLDLQLWMDMLLEVSQDSPCVQRTEWNGIFLVWVMKLMCTQLSSTAKHWLTRTTVLIQSIFFLPPLLMLLWWPRTLENGCLAVRI